MTTESIVLSLMASAIGMAYVVYAKKSGKIYFALSGAGLMSYTYFVESVGLSLLVGAVLIAAPILLDR